MAQRLFSIFEDANETVLLQQCKDDLAAFGFDSFQCSNYAAQVLQEAAETVLTESDNTATNNGVTAEDTDWYWNLPPLARAVMHRFDEVIRGYMWFQCHGVNICMEDLEKDLRQRMPTFGNAGTADGDDAPLPWELSRRFAQFIQNTRQKEQAWREWGERGRQASSMNALIREEIRAGRL